MDKQQMLKVFIKMALFREEVLFGKYMRGLLTLKEMDEERNKNVEEMYDVIASTEPANESEVV